MLLVDTMLKLKHLHWTSLLFLYPEFVFGYFNSLWYCLDKRFIVSLGQKQWLIWVISSSSSSNVVEMGWAHQTFHTHKVVALIQIRTSLIDSCFLFVFIFYFYMCPPNFTITALNFISLAIWGCSNMKKNNHGSSWSIHP